MVFMESKPYLVDWTMNYVKNKDLVLKKLEKIEKEKDGFDLYAKYKDKENYFVVMPILNDMNSLLQRLNGTAHYTIVALNSGENFKTLIENWSKLVHFKFLNMIFVNPFSNLDKRWVIFPHTHDKICDAASLKTGLKSMFEMVEPIEESSFLSKIKG